MNWKDMIQLETVESDPIEVRGSTITLRSQALSVRWPYGGFAWNRPVAVLVDDAYGRRTIPILDVTRVVQILLWTLTVLMAGRMARGPKTSR